MVANQQIFEYVHQQLALGNSADQIKASLAGSGWSQQDIDGAFSETAMSAVPKKRSIVRQILRGIFWAIGIIFGISLLATFAFLAFFLHKAQTDVNNGTANSSETGLLEGVNAAIIQAGLATYQQNHGMYPNSLNLLTPQYFQSVPTDPATQQPYQYEVDEGGMNYQLCATVNGQNNCATASTTIDGQPVNSNNQY